jgi:hypothetical protein
MVLFSRRENLLYYNCVKLRSYIIPTELESIKMLQYRNMGGLVYVVITVSWFLTMDDPTHQYYVAHCRLSG